MTDVDPIINQLVTNDVLGGEFASRYRFIQQSGAAFAHSKHLTTDARQELAMILSERGGQGYPLANVAFAVVLQAKGLVDEYGVPDERAKSFDHKVTKPPYVLHIGELIRDFSDEDIRKVIDTYYELKRASVGKIIDTIVNPGKYPDPGTRGKTNLVDSYYTYS